MTIFFAAMLIMAIEGAISVAPQTSEEIRQLGLEYSSEQSVLHSRVEVSEHTIIYAADSNATDALFFRCDSGGGAWTMRRITVLARRPVDSVLIGNVLYTETEFDCDGGRYNSFRCSISDSETIERIWGGYVTGQPVNFVSGGRAISTYVGPAPEWVMRRWDRRYTRTYQQNTRNLQRFARTCLLPSSIESAEVAPGWADAGVPVFLSVNDSVGSSSRYDDGIRFVIGQPVWNKSLRLEFTESTQRLIVHSRVGWLTPSLFGENIRVTDLRGVELWNGPPTEYASESTGIITDPVLVERLIRIHKRGEPFYLDFDFGEEVWSIF